MPPHSQLQLDIYGELADVMAQAREGGLPPHAAAQGNPRSVFLEHLEKIWSMPDEGIWEIRGAAAAFRPFQGDDLGGVRPGRAARPNPTAAAAGALRRRSRDEIHRDICANGVDKKRGCFVQAYGSSHMDASLLLLPLVGFLPATDKRIKATVREIEKRLMHQGPGAAL